MKTWETYGHEPIKNILSKQLSEGIFPHAYLFFGPAGIGKKSLAMDFSKQILNTENLNTHPDFKILDQEGEITIEPTLEFISTLSFKPFVAKNKVAIINNAQNLNKTSSNALLKSLEEPGSSTVFILLSDGSLPIKTIVSRCQIFNFGYFSEDELEEFSRLKQLSPDKSTLNLSFGSSSRLLKLLKDREFLEQEQKRFEELILLKKQDLSEKIIKISELSELEPQDLKENLLSWMHAQKNILSEKPEEFVKVQALLDAISGLDKNFNKKLVLQGLLQKI